MSIASEKARKSNVYASLYGDAERRHQRGKKPAGKDRSNQTAKGAKRFAHANGQCKPRENQRNARTKAHSNARTKKNPSAKPVATFDKTSATPCEADTPKPRKKIGAPRSHTLKHQRRLTKMARTSFHEGKVDVSKRPNKPMVPKQKRVKRGTAKDIKPQSRRDSRAVPQRKDRPRQSVIGATQSHRSKGNDTLHRRSTSTTFVRNPRRSLSRPASDRTSDASRRVTKSHPRRSLSLRRKSSVHDKRVERCCGSIIKKEPSTSTNRRQSISPGQGGNTALHCLAKEGRLNVLKAKGSELSKFINTPNDGGSTALHLAASNRHALVVRWLIEKGGASVTSSTPKGFSALHIASFRGDCDSIKHLLNASDGYLVLHMATKSTGDTPFLLAARGAKLDVMQALFRADPLVSQATRSASGEPAPHLAILSCQRSGCQGLQKALAWLFSPADKGGAGLDATQLVNTHTGETALHVAAGKAHVHPNALLTIKTLIERCGADPNARTLDCAKGETILHILTRERAGLDKKKRGLQGAVVKWLVNHTKVSINGKDALGQTPLYLAAMNGDKPYASWLVNKCGAELEHVSNGGINALGIAAQESQWGVVKWLVEEKGMKVIHPFLPTNQSALDHTEGADGFGDEQSIQSTTDEVPSDDGKKGEAPSNDDKEEDIQDGASTTSDEVVESIDTNGDETTKAYQNDKMEGTSRDVEDSSSSSRASLEKKQLVWADEEGSPLAKPSEVAHSPHHRIAGAPSPPSAIRTGEYCQSPWQDMLSAKLLMRRVATHQKSQHGGRVAWVRHRKRLVHRLDNIEEEEEPVVEDEKMKEDEDEENVQEEEEEVGPKELVQGDEEEVEIENETISEEQCSPSDELPAQETGEEPAETTTVESVTSTRPILSERSEDELVNCILVSRAYQLSYVLLKHRLGEDRKDIVESILYHAARKQCNEM